MMVRLTLLTTATLALCALYAENASARGRCGGCCGGCAPCGVYVAPCPVVIAPPPCGQPVPPPKKHKKVEVSEAPAKATLVVELPADARLFVDNRPTASTTSTRVFETPVL